MIQQSFYRFRICAFRRLISVIFFILFVIFIAERKYHFSHKMPFMMESRQYAVLIDCGSSGSRIYIYYWSENEQYHGMPSIKRLLDTKGNVVTFKARPGLSNYVDSPSISVAHIYDLVLRSYKFIPENSYSNTVLYVFATGGMRLVPQTKAKFIMSTLSRELPQIVKYRVNRVEIIPGAMEGVFMWISLNYIFRNFQDRCGQTSGTFEVGGASIQLAFEVKEHSDVTAVFTYQCPVDQRWIQHHIFSVTFLGFGANSAFNTYQTNAEKSINDPCLALNCPRYYNDSIAQGTGESDLCFSQIAQIFDKQLRQKDPLSTLNIFRKNIKLAYSPSMSFYGLSELWYSFKQMLEYEGPLDPTKYWTKVKTDCSSLLQKLNKNEFSTKEEKYLKSQCFKAPYMRYLLAKFVPTPPNGFVKNIESLNGVEIEWTYGAIVYYISQKPR